MTREKKKEEDISKFDAIVEILFGNEKRKYDTLIDQMGKHIQKLENQVEENRKDYNNKLQLLSAEIAGNIADLDKSLLRKISESNEQLTQKINALDQSKADKKVLAENLGDLIKSVLK